MRDEYPNFEFVYDHLRYKYRLREDAVSTIDLGELDEFTSLAKKWRKKAAEHFPEDGGFLVDTPYIKVRYFDTGELVMICTAGYSWNGPNVVPDKTTNLRASLFHDAWYQAMGLGLADVKLYKKLSDILYWYQCRQDRMGRIRAWMQFKAVDLFGNP